MVPEGLCSFCSLRQRWWRFTAWCSSSSQRGICIWAYCLGDYQYPEYRRPLYTSAPPLIGKFSFPLYFFSWRKLINHLRIRLLIRSTLFSWLEWHHPLIFQGFSRKRYVNYIYQNNIIWKAEEKKKHHYSYNSGIHAEFCPLSYFNLLQDVSQRKIRFTTTHPPEDLFDKIERSASEMGFQVQRGHGKVSTGVPSARTL